MPDGWSIAKDSLAMDQGILERRNGTCQSKEDGTEALNAERYFKDT